MTCESVPVSRKQDARRSGVQTKRFTSLQFQISEITLLGNSVNRILELGPGHGYLSTMAKLLGYDVTTVDLDPENGADYLGDVRSVQIDETFDLVAAFEILEHMPYRDSMEVISSLRSLTERYLFVSVPAQSHSLRVQVQVPHIIAPRRLGFGWLRSPLGIDLRWEWPRAQDLPLVDREDYWNPHYWELGRRSYPKSRFLGDLRKAGFQVVKSFHNPAHAFHFFVLAQKSAGVE